MDFVPVSLNKNSILLKYTISKESCETRQKQTKTKKTNYREEK